MHWGVDTVWLTTRTLMGDVTVGFRLTFTQCSNKRSLKELDVMRDSCKMCIP